MANIGDINDYGNAEDCLASGARRGLKREFAFISSQTELAATPLSRIRTKKSKNQLVVDDDDDTNNSNNGNIGNDAGPDEEIPSQVVEEADKISDTDIKKRPMKLKDLLKTGLLEGLVIRYKRGPKTKTHLDVPLQGIISGVGILCSCESCGGNMVVSPNVFEVHAGSGNKRPAEYIYMLNGKNLRDVLNLCKDLPLDSIKTAVQDFIRDTAGPSVLNESEDVRSSSVMGEDREYNPPQIWVDSEPTEEILTGSENAVSAVVASLLPPPPPPPQNTVSVKKPLKSKPAGKLTKKDLRFHKLALDVIPDGTLVSYRVRNQDVRKGFKQGSAILCECCKTEVSPSLFEAHAGWGSRRKPYLHIFANGHSLHELAIRASKTHTISDKDKDDLCSICAGGDGDGGGLYSCSSCPRVFHTVCQVLPDNLNDGWHCRYCQNRFQTERNADRNANVLADSLEQRCTRVLGSTVQEADDAGCTLCRKNDFNKSGFGPRTVMICDQCEKEFHVGCLKDHKMVELKELPEGAWLCCTDCSIIYNALQNRLASGEATLSKSSLDLIRGKVSPDFFSGLDIKWRLLSGKMTSEETRSLLSKSVSIFHDRFDPIEESHPDRSGKIDLIPHMVYGRDLTGQDLGGMYCAVLTVNSKVVCAGVFRIFGTHVAELPLVATSNASEGLGYFQALFSCIEELLASLKVKVIMLPAATEAKSIWTKKFGFVEMSDIEEEECRKQFQLMFFQGTSMLHKPVMVESVV